MSTDRPVHVTDPDAACAALSQAVEVLTDRGKIDDALALGVLAQQVRDANLPEPTGYLARVIARLDSHRFPAEWVRIASRPGTGGDELGIWVGMTMHGVLAVMWADLRGARIIDHGRAQ